MRVLFMGTPEFAVASLRRLAEDGHEICGVVTQPDKPKNRGMKLIPTPVKECAVTLGIDVFQPQKARDGEAMDLVRRLAPELIVAAAYGKILPEELLNYPKHGSINVHSSLLPKYRGAAPINWAILNGDGETGVSIMYMVDKLDAGDVISKIKTPIGPDEDAQALTARLAELGAEALSEAIVLIENGTAVRTVQDEEDKERPRRQLPDSRPDSLARRLRRDGRTGDEGFQISGDGRGNLRRTGDAAFCG